MSYPISLEELKRFGEILSELSLDCSKESGVGLRFLSVGAFQKWVDAGVVKGGGSLLGSLGSAEVSRVPESEEEAVLSVELEVPDSEDN